MAGSPGALEADWLGACRRATDGLRDILADHPTTGDRVAETGERGEGGDRTLVIDQMAEDGVFRELERLHSEGHRFRAVSEERGAVDFGSDDVVVVIDPIDGSLNAKRGLASVGISIAVARGDTMKDVVFGFVADLGTGSEFVASEGQGVMLDGRRVDPPGERRNQHGKLEIVAIESASPAWIAPAIGGLQERVHRMRAFGSIAISLAQVAMGRVDGMVTLWRTRAVDCAAGQLLVRESGGHVAFLGYEDLSAPLDLQPHAPLIAARTPEGLEDLAAVVEWQDR